MVQGGAVRYGAVPCGRRGAVQGGVGAVRCGQRGAGSAVRCGAEWAPGSCAIISGECMHVVCLHVPPLTLWRSCGEEMVVG